MVDTLQYVVGVKIIPAIGIFGHDLGGRCNVVTDAAISSRLGPKRGRKYLTVPLPDNHALTFAILIAGQPAVTTVLSTVRGFDVAAEIRSIHLNDFSYNAELISFHLRSHRYAELVGQDPRRLLLNARVAAEREGRLTLNLVAENDDCREISLQG